ncbi:MAG TPA: DUF4166 domain-containing protein [Croceibacterium sp.]
MNAVGQAAVRDEDNSRAPAFRRVLGPTFDTLPEPVRALHDLAHETRWTGRAEVRRGPGLIARAVCAAIGFPRAGRSVPLTVTVTPGRGAERWTRDFDGRRFASVLRPGSGSDAGMMVERFGAISIALLLRVEHGRLYLLPHRWSAFGVPLPRLLLPVGDSFEHAVDGRFAFDVEIGAPLVGRIVAYRGTLEPAA